jgi:hypothetical protein
MGKTRSKRVTRSAETVRVFSDTDLVSGDGMLTTVWGPSLWHVLHTMSFNYPIEPTQEQRRHYRDFMLNLVNVLPCKYCRENLKKNFKQQPLRASDMKSRQTFSLYVYNLHELVNKMLKKKSGLTYEDVRERYEHFRARCTLDDPKVKMEAKGCTEPLYGKKAKGVIHIIPQDVKCDTIQINPECLKRRTCAINPSPNTK